MTLIAAFEADSFPVLLGDLTISQMGAVRPSISVPTRTDLSRLLPEDWLRSVVGLKRKIGKINDRIVYGWTGRFLAAKSITKYLKEQIGYSEIDIGQLSRLIVSSDNWGNVECTLIGWLIEGQETSSFKFDFRRQEISVQGHPYIEGSGASDFSRYITGGTMGASRASNPVFSAVGKSLAQAANVLGREILWGQSLQNLYGGGMEVLFFYEGLFHQLDDVAYLFWTADIENERPVRLRFIPTLMRYKYLNDILIIETNRPEQVHAEKGGSLLHNRLEPYIVLPVYMDEISVGSALEYSLTNPNYLCNFVYVLVPDIGHMYLCFIFPNDIRKGMMEFRLANEGGEDELELSEKFQPFIERHITRKIQDCKVGRL